MSKTLLDKWITQYNKTCKDFEWDIYRNWKHLKETIEEVGSDKFGSEDMESLAKIANKERRNAVKLARQDVIKKTEKIINEFESMEPPHIINHTVNVNPHYSFCCSFCGYDWENEDILDKDPDMKCICGKLLRHTLKERKTHDQEVRQYIPIVELKTKIGLLKIRLDKLRELGK